ncbi:hypothetical protein D8674_017529 [Pyrus ussuriensis x Pyrus communis]|uniref:Uncharacterized protein n=1 Tax=Pyrus ussuriensis x Pyrus communis TaxID=2448454 RepID=A0A5N5HCZ5_9ROSA|nr:hypothetical protein D8674_017529 [Pyrus ussuriensis x Pyrus communis]
MFLIEKQVVHVESDFLQYMDVANIMHLLIVENVNPFHYNILLADAEVNLVFCDLGGKVKHFRHKLVKDGIPNSRKFVTFNIPSEPKWKNVSAKSRMGNGSSNIVFFSLLDPQRLHNCMLTVSFHCNIW